MSDTPRPFHSKSLWLWGQPASGVGVECVLRVAGIGRESILSSGKIGLGTPPVFFPPSNPFRLRMILFGRVIVSSGSYLPFALPLRIPQQNRDVSETTINVCPSHEESEGRRGILRFRSGSGFRAPLTRPGMRADQFPRDDWLARVSAAPAGTASARVPVSIRAR